MVLSQALINFNNYSHFSLIATWLERAQEALEKNSKYLKSKNALQKVPLGTVCEYVAKHYVHGMFSTARLKNLVYKRKSDPGKPSNPISVSYLLSLPFIICSMRCNIARCYLHFALFSTSTVFPSQRLCASVSA